MSVAKSASLTLEEFLKLPETKPASLYIDGEIIGLMINGSRIAVLFNIKGQI